VKTKQNKMYKTDQAVFMPRDQLSEQEGKLFFLKLALLINNADVIFFLSWHLAPCCLLPGHA
jgi:hypothetical protein